MTSFLIIVYTFLLQVLSSNYAAKPNFTGPQKKVTPILKERHTIELIRILGKSNIYPQKWRWLEGKVLKTGFSCFLLKHLKHALMFIAAFQYGGGNQRALLV